jgi:hypothetical protein
VGLGRRQPDAAHPLASPGPPAIEEKTKGIYIMKTTLRLLSLLLLFVILAIPGVALAQGGQPQDQVVLGGTYNLPAGQSVGNLTILGGSSVLEAGSTVADHITLLGGSLTVNGAVKGDIRVYGGQLNLGQTAVVSGGITLAGGNLERASGAQVAGNVTRTTAPFGITIPENPVITMPRSFPAVDSAVSQGFWFLMQTLGLTALAMLVILFAPKVTERMGDAAVAQPLAAGLIGLLVAVVTPPLLIGFAITLIGIPITLALLLAASILLTFGWIALGLEVGKRLGQVLHQQWPTVISAGLGTLLLSLVANGIGLTPCVGWIVPVLVGFVGMGGVLLSRFGTRVYPTATAMPA